MEITPHRNTPSVSFLIQTADLHLLAPLTPCIQTNWQCAASVIARISLCHCPTNSLHFFFFLHTGGGYVISYGRLWWAQNINLIIDAHTLFCAENNISTMHVCTNPNARLQTSCSSMQLSWDGLHNCGAQWETVCPDMSLFQLWGCHIHSFSAPKLSSCLQIQARTQLLLGFNL